MKTLQFNQNDQGYLFLSDLQTGKLFYPCEPDGNFIDVLPEDFKEIHFVTDAFEIYPVAFINETGLGWIANAINAFATIGSSIIGARTTKKANEAIESQLRIQQQIETLKAQSAERQAALLNQQQSGGLSPGEIIGLGVAGIAVIGSVIFLLTSTNGETKTGSDNQDKAQSDTSKKLTSQKRKLYNHSISENAK